MVHRSNQDKGMPGAHLEQHVSKLSSEAFMLAKQAADLAQTNAQLKKRAESLNRQLSELLSQIQDLPDNKQEQIAPLWTDGQLDLDYVLSEGEQPTSTRLYHYLQDQKEN